MKLIKYEEKYLMEMFDLFYNTVHYVNAKDYNKSQLDVWAKKEIDLEAWNKSFLNHYTVVAIEDYMIVGFGDIDIIGYLDRLYVHKDYQKRGIGSIICNELEKHVIGDSIETHASITAKPFFEKRGYKSIKPQTVIRDGVKLLNYIMLKTK